MKKCKHKLDNTRTKCCICEVKVLGIAKKDLKEGEEIIILEMKDKSLKSDKINFLESINKENLL